MRNPYPEKTGSSFEEWAQYIVAVLKWKQSERGVTEWEDTLDYLGKRGLQVANKLAEKGIIEIEIGDKSISGQPKYGAYGKHIGYGETKHWKEFKIKAGPNFR